MKIKISPLFYLFGAYLALTGKAYGFVCYITALALHEWAHAEKAAKLGYEAQRITLTPFGASMEGSFGAMRPSDEIKIALAGPKINLLCALIITGLWWLFPDLYFFTRAFAAANCALALYNLIPSQPLDGGRIVFSLARKRGKRGEYISRITSAITATFMAAGFILSCKSGANVTLALAAVFMAKHAIAPDKTAVYRRLYDKVCRLEKFRRGLPVKVFAVTAQTKVRRVKRLMSPDYYSIFNVADRGITFYESDLDFTVKKQEGQTLAEAGVLNEKHKNSDKNRYFS